jgi:hypothetical protein
MTIERRWAEGYNLREGGTMRVKEGRKEGGRFSDAVSSECHGHLLSAVPVDPSLDWSLYDLPVETAAAAAALTG